MDRDAGDDDAYRDHARQKLDAHLPDRDEKATETLLEHAVVPAGRRHLRGCPARARSTAPPHRWRSTWRCRTSCSGPRSRLSPAAGLPPHTTLVVEKPFGTDLDDAKALNALIARSFDERDVFRIDHFLAKQTVLDVLGLRFANRIFEPVWNSDHISRVDITWYESLGLEGRANYYDRAGALRDMIQNHLLQMLALVAMDPPRSITERDLRDRKVEALRAVVPPKPDEMAKATRRARYTAGTVGGKELPAYADAEGVDPSRRHRDLRRGDLPRLELAVGAARRSGCAPARRSGRSGARSPCTSRSVPHEPFDDRDRPNVLRFTLSPDAISLELNLNGEGDPFDLERVTLDNDFPTQELPPYSLLLKEIARGRSHAVHPGRRGRGAVADRRAGAAGVGARRGTAGGVPGRVGRAEGREGAAHGAAPSRGTAAGDDPRSG